jgi:hypothetical protein
MLCSRGQSFSHAGGLRTHLDGGNERSNIYKYAPYTVHAKEGWGGGFVFFNPSYCTGQETQYGGGPGNPVETRVPANLPQIGKKVARPGCTDGDTSTVKVIRAHSLLEMR